MKNYRLGKVLSLEIIFFIALISVFLFLLYQQHSQIFYVGDDFGRGSRTLWGWQKVIYSALVEYFCCTGRFTSTVATYFFLNGHFIIWKIFNPIIITILALIISRIAKDINTNTINKVSVLLFVLYFFLTLQQILAREVLYWMTGTFYYLWPTTLSMLFIFFGIDLTIRIVGENILSIYV